MADNDTPQATGTFHSYMTPSGYTQRAQAQKYICDPNVPPAAESIMGHCEYYYRPLQCAYTETVEKVSLSSAWETIKAFATSWDPWTDKAVAARLLNRREQLIAPQCTDSDWSRHSNFMMRHIGCEHKPPSYYVSYGYYYCSNYGAKLFPTLSAAGQAWLVSARWYLQFYMEKGLAQNMMSNVIQLSSNNPRNGSVKMNVRRFQLELDSDTFKKFSFNTHPMAYLDGGLAGVSPLDLAKIMHAPDLQEWGNFGTYKQVAESGWGAAQTWTGSAVDEVSSGTDDLVSRTLNWLTAK